MVRLDLMRKDMVNYGFIATSILLLDQLSKWLVVRYLSFDRIIAVMPCLDLQLAFNKGAAFGFLANASGWQRLFFIGLAIFVSVSIIVWLKKLEKKDFWEGVALAGILGGALGNLVDRIRLGVVIDFIDVYYQDWHWYTFNLADSAICISTVILILTVFKRPS